MSVLCIHCDVFCNRDHSSGNEKIVELLGKKLIVYGGDDRIPAMTKKVTHGDEFKIGSLMVKALFTPCHTSGHICYHVTADEDPPGAVFTGDTLFVGSCGKFFEGTANQMYTAMYDILGKLPEDTKVYCGHEYGLMCMKYCVFVEPSNQRANEKLIWAQEQRQNNLPTVPSTIADEKLYNPFMRVHTDALKQYTGETDPIKVTQKAREMRNQWKPPK